MGYKKRETILTSPLKKGDVVPFLSLSKKKKREEESLKKTWRIPGFKKRDRPFHS